MKKRLLFTFIFLLVYASSWAQNIITGTVLDKNNQQPIIGATITAGKKGTVTDPEGKFKLDAPAGTLVVHVTFIGYQPQDVPVGKNALRILLSPDERSLEQVVVVGYGTQKKANLTGAVNTVDVTKSMQGRPITDPSKALQGISPGLNIQYSNGGLTAGPSINIRGMGSINGSNRPLILVDNVETPDLTMINPEDIESVSVLKDAASTSIYGARAAFGVVLIKTKSGVRNMPTRVTYSNNFGWNSPTSLPDFADPVKELTGIINAAKRVGPASPELFGMQLSKLRDGIKNWQDKYANNRTSNEMVPGEDFDLPTATSPAYFYRVWDVKDIMLRKWSPQQVHNLSVQGGGEKVSYFLSAGYNNTGGVMKLNPDQVKKYNITGAVNASVTNWLDLDLKMMYRNFEYDYPYQYQNYFQYMWRWGAYFPYGTYKGNYFRHTPGYIANAPTNDVVDNYTRVNMGATLKLTKDLNVRADYTIGRDNIMRHEIGGKVMLWDFWQASMPLKDLVDGTSDNKMAYRSSRYKVNTFNIYATYDKKLNKDHSIKVMVGANAEDADTVGVNASRLSPLDQSKPEFNLAVGNMTTSGYHLARAYAGFFGRVNYNYKDKWLLELNGRYDGASSFPPADRWAFFPSASAGYRISQENFMQPLSKVLSDMKIRASYGSLGNQDLGGVYYIPYMGTSSLNWIVNGINAPGVGAPTAVTKSLTWETVRTLDFGTDISLFNNNINVTFDWYQRSTSDMLTSKAVPSAFGTAAPMVNSGSLRTRGYEISVDANYPLRKDWMIYGTLSFWDNKTYVTEWDNPSMLLTQNYQGKQLGEIWGFETDRYFTKDDDMSKMPDQSKLTDGTFKYGPGDIKFKDLDGNGVIDGGKGTLAEHGDLKRIGNTLPRYQYSVRLGTSFKQFDFDVLFQGVGKQNYWGTGDLAIPLYRAGDILYDHQLDYWTEDNPNAKYPNPYPNNANGKVLGLAAANGGNNFYPQSKYLLNLAYLRLKNITLGYTLPDALVKRAHLQKVRVYGSAQNIATISNVGVPIDPEITTGEANIYGRTWPFQKTWSFGLQVNF
ncbi:SusC/RagA family TonB-linked outer membrane protein [Chitinophaga varians]|uniref:SusC/RagA family TonB-linked outer membrane protein n=1 Tax=Chitinophaga varians TaxID=2202339 RepID=UPI00165F1715|nr:TonB-dependent receptor [Chitinophaga varians]MBC9914350.1 TonB-dependent receptor [Chitinophaga varians]